MKLHAPIERWGDVCVTAAIASRWADQLLPLTRHAAADRRRGVFAFAKGTGACYSALFKAGRHDELLELLALDQHPIWPDAVWGGRVLLARGQADEAIAYMVERSCGVILTRCGGAQPGVGSIGQSATRAPFACKKTAQTPGDVIANCRRRHATVALTPFSICGTVALPWSTSSGPR